MLVVRESKIAGRDIQQEVTDAFVRVLERHTDDPRGILLMESKGRGAAWVTKPRESNRFIDFDITPESIEEAFDKEAQVRIDVNNLGQKASETAEKYGVHFSASVDDLDNFASKIPEMHQLFENIASAAAKEKTKNLYLNLHYNKPEYRVGDNDLTLTIEKAMGQGKNRRLIKTTYYHLNSKKLPTKEKLAEAIKKEHAELKQVIVRHKQAQKGEKAAVLIEAQKQEEQKALQAKVNSITTQLTQALNIIA